MPDKDWKDQGWNFVHELRGDGLCEDPDSEDEMQIHPGDDEKGATNKTEATAKKQVKKGTRPKSSRHHDSRDHEHLSPVHVGGHAPREPRSSVSRQENERSTYHHRENVQTSPTRVPSSNNSHLDLGADPTKPRTTESISANMPRTGRVSTVRNQYELHEEAQNAKDTSQKQNAPRAEGRQYRDFEETDNSEGFGGDESEYTWR